MLFLMLSFGYVVGCDDDGDGGDTDNVESNNMLRTTVAIEMDMMEGRKLMKQLQLTTSAARVFDSKTCNLILDH